MDTILLVLIIIFSVLLLVLGIETIIYLKKNEGKLIEDIRKKLLIRIDLLTVLTVVVGIISIVKIILSSI